MPSRRDDGRGRNRGPSPEEIVKQQVIARLTEERARQRALNASMAAARAQTEAKWRKQSKEPQFLTLRRLAAGAIALFFFVFFASQFGIHLPSLHASSGDSSVSTGGGGGNDGGPAPDSSGHLPIVPEAIRCQINDSPRINLTTPERVRNCEDAKSYAKTVLVQKFGDAGGEAQFLCQDKLWNGESVWSAWAINLGSGAYGIAQALGHGHVYDVGDWKAQVDWGLNYIFGRYKTPCGAWNFWNAQSPHWY